MTVVRGSESLASFTIASFTLVGHHALGWRLMLPKEMETLAAFSAREVKRVAEAEKRDIYSSAEGQ